MDRVELSACPGDKPPRIELLDSREQVLTAQYLMQLSNASSKTVMDRRNVASINARFLVDLFEQYLSLS
jgi:hypothetical protein